jgi:hypothetical protein
VIASQLLVALPDYQECFIIFFCHLIFYSSLLDLVDQLKVVGQLELLVDDLLEQHKRMHKAAATCLEAVNMLNDDPDNGKASALWEEGWDDLMRSAAMYRYCIDGIAKATASIKGTPLDGVLKENQVCSEFVEDYARTARESCTTVEDFLSTSR